MIGSGNGGTSGGLTPLQNTQFSALTGLLNNMSTSQPSFGDPYVDGTNIKIDITSTDGLPLPFQLADVWYTYPVPFTVTLNQGVKNEPRWQEVALIYSEQSGGIIPAVSDQIIQGAAFPLMYTAVETYTELGTDRIKYLQRTTEDTSHNDSGALSRMRLKQRVANEKMLLHGCETVYLSNADGSQIDLTIMSGRFFQLNEQDFSDENGTGTDQGGILAINTYNTVDATRPKDFDVVTNLADFDMLQDGTTISTDSYVVLHVYGIGNNTPDNCWAAISPASIEFSTLEAAKQFAAAGEFASAPNSIKNVTFPVSTVILKKTATGFNNGFTTLTTRDEQEWRNYSIGYRTWKTTNYPNIYPNGMNISHTETAIITGAKSYLQCQAKFSAFVTEANYDYCNVNNSTSASASSNRVRYHGSLGAFWTPIWSGNVITTNATSDGSVQRTGWNISDMKVLCVFEIISGDQSIKTVDRR